MNAIPARIAAVALGLPMVVFGLNKFLLFANFPPPADPTAQLFLGTMFSTYLAKLTGLTELLGGALVLPSRSRTLGWLVLAPVMVNIIVFHLAHDLPGNMLWLFSSAAFAAVGVAQRRSLLAILRGGEA